MVRLADEVVYALAEPVVAAGGAAVALHEQRTAGEIDLGDGMTIETADEFKDDSEKEAA